MYKRLPLAAAILALQQYLGLADCPEGWEEDQVKWQTNVDKFVEPDCYSFEYVESRIAGAAAAPNLVLVQNGVVVTDDGLRMLSLRDYLADIGSSCYANCPFGGAHCRVTYYGAGYPFRFHIDQDLTFVGEELSLEISQLAEVDCASIIVPTAAPTAAPTAMPTVEEEEEEESGASIQGGIEELPTEPIVIIVGTQEELSSARSRVRNLLVSVGLACLPYFFL